MVCRSKPQNLRKCHAEFTEFFHGKVWSLIINDVGMYLLAAVSLFLIFCCTVVGTKIYSVNQLIYMCVCYLTLLLVMIGLSEAV